MEPRTLQYLAEACGGQRLSGPAEARVCRVCTDSRAVQAGDLFVPLRGERFDGHEFINQVAEKGAAASLVERTRIPSPLPACGLIAVNNTRTAFGRMASRYRDEFPLPIIAVGGSNGKTTTKELICSVLGQKFRALGSRASFNNDIGVPATLLELGLEHQVAVLEFGTNHPGELAPLLRLAKPRYGVITSIGREHLEFFGDLPGVIEEEGWIAELLPADGKLFVNGDSPGVDLVARRAATPVVRIGFGVNNEWRARLVRLDNSGLSFAVEGPQLPFNRNYRLPLVGRHQIVNALFAIALGAELGMTPEQVGQGLLQSAPAKMRLQLWHYGEVLVLDDSYNANADSMRAALETLRDLPCRGRRLAVLGEMAELGEHSESAHAEIGAYAASLGVQRLFAVGRMASVVGAAARAGGLDDVGEFTGIPEAARAIKYYVRPGDLVLLKASRASGLDKIGEMLRRDDLDKRSDDPGQGPNPLGSGSSV